MKKLMVLVAAIAMMASSAYAADWNFYGSARIQTFYANTEVIDSGADVTNLEESLQGNSRIGANVKVSDELTGRFEYGASGGNANIRLLYGTWNFGAGKLIVGQAYTPLNWFYSDQVFDGDADLLPYGGMFSGRAGQLQLVFGGFKLAFVAPSVAGVGVGATTEVKLPTIEATYSLALDNITIDLGAGYNTFENKVGTVENDVDAYVLALGAKGNFGSFYLAGNIYAGENTGYIMSLDTDGNRGWADGRAVAGVAGDVLDTDVLGYALVAGYTFNDMFKMEVGYAGANAEVDGAADDKVQSYYLNGTVTLAPGVFFVPEIGVIDGDEAGDTETTYGGIKWQINF